MTIIYIIFAFTFIAFSVPFFLRYFYTYKITNGEIFSSIIISIFASIICFLLIFKDSYNIEILHGYVFDKKQEIVSCSHSYKCGCVETTDSNGNKSETCSLCYRHPHDYNWNIYTTLGTFSIDRVDSQGSIEPKRFSIVNNGDSVSTEHFYIDYLSGAKHSLFNNENNLLDIDDKKYSLPDYPEVFDYYNTNLVLNSHLVPKKTSDEINYLLRKSLNTIAHKKQSNILIVFTKYDRNFGNYLQQSWNNGRKNDQIIVVGLNSDSSKISWVYSFGWSSNQMVNISIREQIENLSDISNPSAFVSIIVDNVNKYFSRIPMNEYKYLLMEVNVPIWVSFFCIFIQISFNFLFAIFIVKNKITNYYF